jgi:MoaA/NifB/PqqE/SkfB family radical SAM enzyme
MAAAGRTPPIIQIHPTTRCNLRCLHCYSDSGPQEPGLLGYELVRDALSAALDQGYTVASFSGGEPLLCRDLGRMLRHAKELGMRTTVTSNGMLLSAARLALLAGHTDVLAISLDGVPESHNRMRASERAFDRMSMNLEGVRQSGICFGFIFTLTQFNVNEVAWAAEFALEQGARLFQIHPLEEVGRAADVLAGARPDELELAFAYLEAERLRTRHGTRLFIQLDVFHRQVLAQHPEWFYAEKEWPVPGMLAECLAPLVLEADATAVPLGYGFGRRYAIGNLMQEPLGVLARRWMRRGHVRFRRLCRRVYEEACKPSELPFLNWYELIALRSLDAARAAPRAAALGPASAPSHPASLG